MTEHAEIAGLLQVKWLYGESLINQWLQDNGDLEIVDIKPMQQIDDEGVFIVYRKED